MYKGTLFLQCHMLHTYTHLSTIAGTASHSLDFKKSAGGFIHGFRYTGKLLPFVPLLLLLVLLFLFLPCAVYKHPGVCFNSIPQGGLCFDIWSGVTMVFHGLQSHLLQLTYFTTWSRESTRRRYVLLPWKCCTRTVSTQHVHM